MKIIKHHDVLHLIYSTIDEIPDDIIAICNAYEGSIPHRVGFNFPIEFVKQHQPTCSLLAYKAKYVIAYKKGDILTKKHELQHARFHLDINYRQQVESLWNSLSHSFQKRVIRQLRNMKYPNDPQILLDEFQAYYFTEKPNFFGKES
jgi:hypothetical protein